jgi:hypothetical protein
MVKKGLFQSNPTKQIHDQYYTRKSHWEDIQDFIPRDKIIWEGCMLNSLSKSPVYLQEMGFDVEWNVDEDIFTQQKRDDSICVTNIPFAFKKEIFQHLKDIGQAFILLCPSTCLHTKYFYEIFGKEKIQFIIPSTKRHFDKYADGVKIEQKDNCSFYTLYICFKANLENDVNFIK